MRKAVLAGCGGISKRWLNDIKGFDDVRIVGLVDIDPDALEARRKEFNLAPLASGSDLAEVVRASGADTVFDCTVPEAHYQVVLTALAEGCDVLGEKPMADSIAHAREMVSAARQAGKTYAVIQNRRYNPEIIRYRDLVRSGALSDLTTLNADFYIGAHFGGFRDEMEHVLLLDMAIHSFDEARFISGKDPVYVYCYEWNPRGSWYHNGASAVAVFEMTDGVIFTYRGSWCAEGMNSSWECEWRAVCEGGSAVWDGYSRVAAEFVVGEEGFRRPLESLSAPSASALPHDGHAGVIREFLDSLEAGTEPQTVCTDNVKSVAMVYAAVASATSGKREPVVW